MGKAKTVHLPQTLIEQNELREAVKLATEPGRIIICGTTCPRAGGLGR